MLLVLQAKERSQLEAQLAEAEQRLATVQRERVEHEQRLSAATDSVEGAPFKGWGCSMAVIVGNVAPFRTSTRDVTDSYESEALYTG